MIYFGIGIADQLWALHSQLLPFFSGNNVSWYWLYCNCTSDCFSYTFKSNNYGAFILFKVATMVQLAHFFGLVLIIGGTTLTYLHDGTAKFLYSSPSAATLQISYLLDHSQLSQLATSILITKKQERSKQECLLHFVHYQFFVLTVVTVLLVLMITILVLYTLVLVHKTWL